MAIMNCPSCNSEESKVIDSRESPDGIRRRRECLRCRQRYTTYERVHTVPLMVAKRDNRREPFSAEKLERSFRIACARRPLEVGAISKMVSRHRKGVTPARQAGNRIKRDRRNGHRTSQRTRQRRVHPLRVRLPGFPGRREFRPGSRSAEQ